MFTLDNSDFSNRIQIARQHCPGWLVPVQVLVQMPCRLTRCQASAAPGATFAPCALNY